MKKEVISEESKEQSREYETIKQLIKMNQKKRVDKRLQVIRLYLEGKSEQEIAAKLDYSRKWVKHLCKEYQEKGLKEYARHKYGGNHRSMSMSEEESILKQFEAKIEKGEVVTAIEIKKAFDEKLGRDTVRGYIYMLLARHKYCKLVPRPSHPKKASEAEIAASKKLI
jgi:transposase